MQKPFDDNYKEIADGMGISLYQRFTLNEASLFLRCPTSDLQNLVKKKEIQYIQVSKTEVQLFGYQLLQHLLNNVVGNSPRTPTEKPNETQYRILRAHEVQQIVGLSRSTLWRLERKGQFPARLSLGVGSVGWMESDIEAWVKTRKLSEH